MYHFLVFDRKSTAEEKKAAAVGVGAHSGNGDSALSDLEARLNNLNK